MQAYQDEKFRVLCEKFVLILLVCLVTDRKSYGNIIITFVLLERVLDSPSYSNAYTHTHTQHVDLFKY